jgi:hypothetical protein
MCRYGFDLEMPADFTPTPCDGEVERFYLWPLDKVKETILNGEWKANCAIGKLTEKIHKLVLMHY